MDRYQITFQTWNKIASLYQDKFMHLDLYDDTYDKFCQLIEKQDASVFEIGCGPGNITKYLLSKRPDLRIEGTDIAPNMIRLAELNNPSASFRVMDCREIHTLNARYDAIMCGFCMPYLSKDDCSKLIKDSSALLNDGGIIYFSVIEGDYNDSGFEAGSSGDESYVYYHQEEHLLEKLKENNFELMELIRKPYQRSETTTSTHMIFIAKKK